jgi:hypothetical protein
MFNLVGARVMVLTRCTGCYCTSINCLWKKIWYFNVSLKMCRVIGIAYLTSSPCKWIVFFSLSGNLFNATWICEDLVITAALDLGTKMFCPFRYHYNVADARLHQHIEKGNEDGLFISSVASSTNLWALIMDAGTGFSSQVYELSPIFLHKVRSEA